MRADSPFHLKPSIISVAAFTRTHKNSSKASENPSIAQNQFLLPFQESHPRLRWSVLFSGAVSILAAEVVLEWEEKQSSKWEDTGGGVHVYFSLKVNIQISLISGY